MNYAEARQSMLTGMWSWTTARDNEAHQSAPCDASCRHEAKADAEKHFYEMCLNMATPSIDGVSMLKCTHCGSWTTGRYGNKELWLLFKVKPYCLPHAKPEFLRLREPLTSGLKIIHS